ncbi:autophagy protein 5 [Aspergillus pseudonomiae]
MGSQATLNSIQKAVWDGRLPLQIRLAPSESRIYDQSDPYLISYPRISYLPSLLPRLRAFFASSLIDPSSQAHDGWFSFEGVPLKWHLPIGLLYDLYAGADPASKGTVEPEDAGWDIDNEDSPLPWRLVVHFSDWPDEELVRLDAEGMVMNDAFINSVKEADFLRNGTAKGIMSLSKEDSSGLWKSVQDDADDRYSLAFATPEPVSQSEDARVSEARAPRCRCAHVSASGGTGQEFGVRGWLV